MNSERLTEAGVHHVFLKRSLHEKDLVGVMANSDGVIACDAAACLGLARIICVPLVVLGAGHSTALPF